MNYTNRVDTAYDWWTDKSNNRFIYVALHSNAHGTINCGHSGGNHGGTQILAQSSHDGGLDVTVGGGAGEAYQQVAGLSPSTAHEVIVTDRCTNTAAYGALNGVHEICSSKAQTMRTIYMENDFHDTTGGANWLYANDGEIPRPPNIAIEILRGIQCYYNGGSYCSL